MQNNIVLVGIISVITSLVCFIFVRGVDLMVMISKNHFNMMILLIPLVYLIIKKFLSPAVAKSSTKLVVMASSEYKPLALVIIPIQIVGTWLSMLVATSVSTVGVGVQIGGVIADNLSRYYKIEKDDIIAIGMASGFTALTSSALGGMFFAIKLSNKRDYVCLLYSTFLTKALMHVLGFEPFRYTLDTSLITISNILLAFGLSLIIIAFSYVFVKLLYKMRMVYSDNSKKWLILTSLVALIGIIYVTRGTYSYSGSSLVNDIFYSQANLNWYDFILKGGLSILSISMGFIGGEISIVFATGALLGFSIANSLGLSVVLFAALGYILFFATTTKTYLASFCLSFTVFGTTAVFLILPGIYLSYRLDYKTSIYS